MRSFRAARRSAERRPVPFLFVYEEMVETKDPETDEVVGVEYEERREVFECRGEVSTLLLSELAYNSDVDVADPAAMGLIRQFFAQAFGDDDQYRRFFNLQIKHGDDELLMEILGGLVEDFAARPTKPPSPSEPGLSSDGALSKVVSLSRGSVEIVEGSVIENELTEPEEGSPVTSSG